MYEKVDWKEERQQKIVPPPPPARTAGPGPQPPPPVPMSRVGSLVVGVDVGVDVEVDAHARGHVCVLVHAGVRRCGGPASAAGVGYRSLPGVLMEFREEAERR